MKTTEQNENDRTKFLIQNWCFASNLLIKNAERRENEVKARVKSVIAARISGGSLTEDTFDIRQPLMEDNQ